MTIISETQIDHMCGGGGVRGGVKTKIPKPFQSIKRTSEYVPTPPLKPPIKTPVVLSFSR